MKILKYYTKNGHNFGVESDIPPRAGIKGVYVQLPDRKEPVKLRALKTYQSDSYWNKSPTLRSPQIDAWLRNNKYHEGQLFSADFDATEDVHIYSNIKPYDE